MLEGLASGLQRALGKLTGKGKLSQDDVQTAMREVRLALLAADVNVRVVKQFVDRVQERAVGQEVQRSLTPGQQVIKIVHEELTELMGGTQARINMAPKPPTKLMLVGLQGAGKTTAAAKLAIAFRDHAHRPLLVAADVYRPAAIQQLKVLGEEIHVPVFDMGPHANPVVIAEHGVDEALRQGCDVVIVDTAGRLHVDDELMDELTQMKAKIQPEEVLLVVDAMTGQDAVHVAESFHERLTLSGVVLTKLDGDTRGGAALTVRSVTGCPIKYVGLSEKIEPLEVFHPDRLASRILGMGDVLGLIERAQQAVDQDQARAMQEKLKSAKFTLDDFRNWMKQAQNMGPLEQVLKMIPGMNKMKGLEELSWKDKRFVRMDAVISSMTKAERATPSVMNASRRRRVASGAGVTVREVNQVLNQFEQMQQMMKRFSGSGLASKLGRRNALSALKPLDGDGGLAGAFAGARPTDASAADGRRHHKKKKKH